MWNEEELLGKYDISLFEQDLKEFGIQLKKRQICQFLKYYELLVEWNSFMNLTGITEFDEVMKKHFTDSLSVYPVLLQLQKDYSFKFNSLIDVGTGAGFPGLPLKILFPEMEVTLLDSLNKRIHFLDTVIDELGLTGIHTVHGRAEDFAKPGKLRSRFDLCVSRAVANLSTLSEYCIPFCRQGGFFISYKSEKVSEEITAGEKAVTLLGGSIETKKEFILPNSDISRTFVIVQKKKETPKKFPRKAGLPSKEPLC